MFEIIRANQRRAALLVSVMGGLLLAAGYALGELIGPGGGLAGLALAVLVWIVLTLVSYLGGDRILLATSRARRIRKQDHPVLWNVVEEMCIASGLAVMPAVYIMDEAAPNAFATGRAEDRSALVVTAGLLERLDRDELQGVVAHELGHIRNRDVLYMMMVGVMMGTIVILADVGTRFLWYGGGRRRTSSGKNRGNAIVLVVALVLVVLAPILAQLMYFALSRRREYLADASGALFTRYPEGLASALEKISAAGLPLRAATRASAPMFIVNPLGLTKRAPSGLSSTHPPVSERVRILRSMAGGPVGLARYDEAFRKVTGRPVGVVPAGAVAASPPAEHRAAASTDPRARWDRLRQTTDTLWRMQDYIFLACSCATRLKVPPEYAGEEIPCPQCGVLHAVPPAA